MKLSYFKQYWSTLKNTAMWNQRVAVVTYHDNRVLWDGTIGEFVEDTNHTSFINNDCWTVVFFGHLAITAMDEVTPAYNRAIEIQVI